MIFNGNCFFFMYVYILDGSRTIAVIKFTVAIRSFLSIIVHGECMYLAGTLTTPHEIPERVMEIAPASVRPDLNGFFI